MMYFNIDPWLASALVRTDSTPLELIPYALLGFLVVMIVLAILMASTSLVGFLFRLVGKEKTGGVPETQKPGGSEPDSETLLVVAAAVAVALDRPHRIASVEKKES